MLIDMTATALAAEEYKDDTRYGYWIMVFSILRNVCNEMMVYGAAPRSGKDDEDSSQDKDTESMLICFIKERSETFCSKNMTEMF